MKLVEMWPAFQAGSLLSWAELRLSRIQDFQKTKVTDDEDSLHNFWYK